VVGESGSGKTTLGLALLRLVSSKGRIVFLGCDIQGTKFNDTRPLRADMQVVFQDPYGSLSPRMPIGEVVAEGLRVHEPKLPSAERDARVIKALEEVGIDPDSRFRYPHEFSGGRELQERHNLSYLFISHDLKVVRALANEVIVMCDGKVVEAGTAEKIFEQPQTDYTRALMAAAFAMQVEHVAAIRD
jgi:microcin C transport system ATP-binding protein